MSHHSEEKLVDFLRQHRTSPPPPKVDLEAQLMAQIEAEANPEKVISFAKKNYPKWAFGGVIVASILLLFTSVRFLQPTPSVSETNQELETFLTENWEAVTTPPPSDTAWQNLSTEPLESSN